MGRMLEAWGEPDWRLAAEDSDACRPSDPDWSGAACRRPIAARAGFGGAGSFLGRRCYDAHWRNL